MAYVNNILAIPTPFLLPIQVSILKKDGVIYFY